MALMKWRPDHDSFGLRREIDRLFDDFFTGDEGAIGKLALIPAIDVTEDKESICVKAELPGVEQKDIQVTLQDGVLVIRGEKRQETEEKDKNFHRVERRYGSFIRSIGMPSSVDPNKVKASFKNGVLSVTVTKKEEAKPKSINIEVK
jgi:HSP20 family protein